MYLNKGKIVFYRILLIIEYIVSAPMLFITVFGIITDIINGEAAENIDIYFILIIPFGAIMLDAIRRQRNVSRAYAFNNQFMGDNDGSVSFETLAKIFGKPELKVLKWFNECVRTGLIKDCFVDWDIEDEVFDDNMYITLKNKTHRTKEPEYRAVVCPNCNASNSVKVGTVGKCQYCDSYING